jgi:hypothetical protein
MSTKTAVRLLLFAVVMFGMAATSSAQFGISVTFGPPPIPVYDQPPCPEDGYIWTPGYWAWDNDGDDYYWVPGTWVPAPEPGFLWTPPYWGWESGVYLFHEGYWGPHIGFYGGINYGFGYFGEGFVGGRWDHDRFYYNRSVMNVVNVRNVYNETVINNNVRVTRVSYNGGPGGIEARPRREDELAGRDRHLPPVGVQTQQLREARSDRELHASANNGRPPVAATARPGDFHEHAVPAREAGGAYHPPANRAQGNRGGPEPRGESANPRTAVHARDLPPLQRPSPPNTGNPRNDQRYQQQQEKLYSKQNQERQKLQQRQEQQDQRLVQRNAAPPQRQKVEQQHQRQTEQLQQRHVQQQQQMQQRQSSHGPPHR